MSLRMDSGRAAEADQEFDLVTFGQLVIVLKGDRLAAVAIGIMNSSGKVPISIVGTEDDRLHVRRMDRASHRRRVREQRASSKV